MFLSLLLLSTTKTLLSTTLLSTFFFVTRRLIMTVVFFFDADFGETASSFAGDATIVFSTIAFSPSSTLDGGRTGGDSPRRVGSLYSIFKKSKIDFSSTNTCSTRSPFFLFSITDSPCSFSVYFIDSACSRIARLNSLLPVKYKTENGYSSGVVYKKSTRLAYCAPGNLATTKHFELPRERTSTMIWRDNNSSINILNTFEWLDVMITSMSPELANPRR